MADPARLTETLDTAAAGDGELRQALSDWLRWLRDEKRASPHTIDAYVRDLAGFLGFVANHLGVAPWSDHPRRVLLQR